jgi:glycosyltransferase involved in cell wall biosynthesis
MHHLSFCILPFLPFRKCKVISWTPGIRASYNLRYNLQRKKTFYDYIYGSILKKSNAIIFYMKEPINFWNKFLDLNKIFIAHNTINVNYELIDPTLQKDIILFVGTLYKEKKIYELIFTYIRTLEHFDYKYFKLVIIGDGQEYFNLKKLIKDKNLDNHIILKGKITNEQELAYFFNRSIACVSPDQAGLSVLLSMGYRVPFITRYNAITGGERLNISNGVNGILYNSQDELRNIFLDFIKSPQKYLNYGNNAYIHYIDNATILHMYVGFSNAINYLTKN